jgi:hypothetical protein
LDCGQTQGQLNDTEAPKHENGMANWVLRAHRHFGAGSSQEVENGGVRPLGGT